MNIERVDLNLLRVFDAVYEDRNLLRAGKRLHLSQSAVSHALTRLRDALQDELFVRTPRGMEPTARAVDMAPPLREALRQIRTTLGVQAFVPEESERRFVIAANDYVTTVLVARLSRHLSVSAPGVEFIVRGRPDSTWPRRSTSAGSTSRSASSRRCPPACSRCRSGASARCW